MGNRILNIRSQQNTTTPQKNVVYSDVDMVSEHSKYSIMQENVELYLACLITEGKIEQAIEFVCSEDGRKYGLNQIFTITFNSKSRQQREKEMLEWFEKSKYSIVKDVNVKAVFNSLHNIFSWIPGERVLDPEFGSKLRIYLYEGINNYNIEQISQEIRSCCTKWEPRVSIVRIENETTVEDSEDNTVRLNIIFTIPGLTKQQYNYTYIYNKPE